MSKDDRLELLKRRKLLEMHRRQLLKKAAESDNGDEPVKERISDPRILLREALVGRGWEVWQAAEQQYPEVARRVKPVLLSLVKSGKLREKITGEQLYWLFSRIGLRIRLNTKIRILEKGELKTIAEKLRE
jgi:DNA-binding TFAR19-related protein (PDSD5 family)